MLLSWDPIPSSDLAITAVQWLYALWPVGLGAAVWVSLRRIHFRNLRQTAERTLRLTFFLWIGFAICYLGLYLLGYAQSTILPEPVNSIAFFSIGAVLSGILAYQFGTTRWRQVRAFRSVQAMRQLHTLSPEHFEEVVAEYFRSQGHFVRHIGQTGDHGVDLVVYTTRQGKWIVQCKRYRGQVGEPIVRDLFGAMHHEHANRAILVTSGTFTEQARRWASGKPIELIDGASLLQRMHGDVTKP